LSDKIYASYIYYYNLKDGIHQKKKKLKDGGDGLCNLRGMGVMWLRQRAINALGLETYFVEKMIIIILTLMSWAILNYKYIERMKSN